MKKLLLVAAFLALVAVAIEMGRRQKAKWVGLTEAELRSKLDEKLASRVPDDKRAEVTDTIVAKMSERGLIAEDSPTEVVIDASAEESAETTT